MSDSVATLAGARALRAARARAKPRTPIALAQRLIKGYVTTPTLTLLSDLLCDAIMQDDARLIISCPPRTGKTMLAGIITPIFALCNDPDASVLIAAHGDQLAEESSREARRLITEHSDYLGISLDPMAGAVGRWKVAGHRGGMWAGAVTGGPVGFGVSSGGLLIIDDPIRGAVEADSPAYRRRLLAEVKTSLLSRLEPGAGCCIVASRWHPNDLAGELLSEPDSPWRLVNVPAISGVGIEDALGRPPGVAMVSALGRDAAGFEEVKRAVGQRAWAAMYLGTPSTPEGSVISAEWIDSNRRPAAPANPTRIVVAVDPAEGGERGDKTGIIGASLARDGVVHLIADVSEKLTSDAWSNRAADLAVELGASALIVEGFSGATTFVRLLREAVATRSGGHPISVSSWPPKKHGRVGDALSRSAGLLAALESGRCVLAGHLPDLESDMTGWQAGSHQPDSVAACQIAFDTLAPAATSGGVVIAPDFTRSLGAPAPPVPHIGRVAGQSPARRTAPVVVPAATRRGSTARIKINTDQLLRRRSLGYGPR